MAEGSEIGLMPDRRPRNVCTVVLSPVSSRPALPTRSCDETAYNAVCASEAWRSMDCRVASLLAKTAVGDASRLFLSRLSSGPSDLAVIAADGPHGSRILRSGALAVLLLAAAPLALAAEAPYPFEGTWVRAERTCTASTVRARTYTAKEVLSPRGRCTIRRIAGSGATYELQEDCGRNEKPPTLTETIRMTSPDSMALKRQLVRLKIPRQIRYVRCTVAGPALAAAQRGGKFGTPDPKSREHDHDKDE